MFYRKLYLTLINVLHFYSVPDCILLHALFCSLACKTFQSEMPKPAPQGWHWGVHKRVLGLTCCPFIYPQEHNRHILLLRHRSFQVRCGKHQVTPVCYTFATLWHCVITNISIIWYNRNTCYNTVLSHAGGGGGCKSLCVVFMFMLQRQEIKNKFRPYG